MTHHELTLAQELALLTRTLRNVLRDLDVMPYRHKHMEELSEQLVRLDQLRKRIESGPSGNISWDRTRNE